MFSEGANAYVHVACFPKPIFQNTAELVSNINEIELPKLLFHMFKGPLTKLRSGLNLFRTTLDSMSKSVHFSFVFMCFHWCFWENANGVKLKKKFVGFYHKNKIEFFLCFSHSIGDAMG